MDRESGKYSYWEDDSLRNDNMGIRLDYQIITAGMRSRVLSGGIYKNQTFSKHGPVIIDYGLGT